MNASSLTRRALLLAAAAAAVPARAADWPTRPLRIVLPFPPGGTSDLVARLLADKLAAALGQPVVVESKPGANGIIASDFVAKSTDGHTLLFASAAHASNATLYPKLPYDSARDFVPVALVVPPGPMVIVAHPSLPANNVRELIDAEYALNEGGGGRVKDGVKLSNDVQASEKKAMDFTLEATNPGGHSSVPVKDNAIPAQVRLRPAW